MGEGNGIAFEDHPGFNDPEYKKRRALIAKAALSYKVTDESIAPINYTENDKSAWKWCYRTMRKRYKDAACEEYNYALN
jgi:hypothetical protein